MDIKEITAKERPAAEIIADLTNKQVYVIGWDTLRLEYDSRLHPVKTDVSYQDIYKDGKVDKMTRIVLPFQKLAVKRMTELVFAIPVKRVYKTNNEQQQEARNIIEDIYRKNRIDAVNLERGRYLYASCETCTLWYTQPTRTLYAGHESAHKLRCKSYSPMKGDSIYPLFDEYDDLIALSVKYCRRENNRDVYYLDTYTDTEHIRWRMDGNDIAEELREEIKLGKISGVYANRVEPIWEDQSENIYEAEWTLSRNGNYIRKNAKPNWVVFSDEGVTFGEEKIGNQEGRNVLQYPANAKAEYVTWQQATESIKFHIEQLTSIFFKSLQLPDMSMENMKTTPMSGEARKMMFIDAQLKVNDEKGIWIEFLSREFNVVREHAKQLFPRLASAFDNLSVDIEITPYTINDESELIGNLSNATGGKAIMSQKTAIENLGYVDDAEEELERITNEGMAGLFNEPTV